MAAGRSSTGRVLDDCVRHHGFDAVPPGDLSAERECAGAGRADSEEKSEIQTVSNIRKYGALSLGCLVVVAMYLLTREHHTCVPPPLTLPLGGMPGSLCAHSPGNAKRGCRTVHWYGCGGRWIHTLAATEVLAGQGLVQGSSAPGLRRANALCRSTSPFITRHHTARLMSAAVSFRRHSPGTMGRAIPRERGRRGMHSRGRSQSRTLMSALGSIRTHASCIRSSVVLGRVRRRR